ncbi:Z1 domain-containing protein [Nocardia sp. NPDC050799]|uniref:Z1 domain-containing protein n=1 Tax=Nocardia sp. NPDC050799 TaxID=3154842 RepID=UPI0033FF0D08
MNDTAIVDEQIAGVILQELKALEGAAPENLLESVAFRARKERPGGVPELEILAVLTAADPNLAAKTKFRILLTKWDDAESGEWMFETAPRSLERRSLVYNQLGFDESSYDALDKEYPRDLSGSTVISVPMQWDPWYTGKRRAEHDFYWSAYHGVLQKGWDSEAITKLDSATDEVVSRLADPERDASYQSKGLVVGYVQSGKTANFTGVIAKAIDAGYRLIIVLTGTVEILRSQTQRRLDMELVGEENIRGGIDPDDAELMAGVDYAGQGDQDWFDGKFLQHGVNIAEQDGIPGIVRLTSPNWDYKKLLAGLGALDFRGGHELAVKSKKLYDPANLHGTNVRLAVVKKHKGTLEKLVADLKRIHTRMDEIPTLIIDDEADQASVNTINPNRKGRSSEEIERTAINKQISALLELLPRCQYIGYTATPFANVFVDPDDSENIFPKDFIVSLDRPVGYMGGSDFYDFDRDFSNTPKTPATSNEAAFVRNIDSNAGDERIATLQRAIDSFVLAGAIKLYRESRGAKEFRHHTMLIHESVKTAEHNTLRVEVQRLWQRSAYSSPVGLDRLRDLWSDDYEPVCRARAEDKAEIPSHFDELIRFIGKAVDNISSLNTPVLVVNGDTDINQPALDFQAAKVWKILVGGTKLSRGFTVEGLTVSYYTRRTLMADTLMQMGRWFGFRRGYRDLVRLYVGRAITAGTKTYDLYEAFGAIIQDEEEFRDELKRFADTEEDGRPSFTPIDVPPLVYQRLPWLKPTAGNKMYNAELKFRGEGAKLVDFTMQDVRGKGDGNAAHFAAILPLLDALDKTGKFEYREKRIEGDRDGSFSARYGLLDAQSILDALNHFRWAPNWEFGPHAAFLKRAIEAKELTDFAILLPLLANCEIKEVAGTELSVPVIKRKRREDRPGFSGSSFRQRQAIEHIAGGDKLGGVLAESLFTPTRGALLLSFAADPHGVDPKTGADPADLKPIVDPKDIATLFSYALPKAAAPGGRIGFAAKKKGRGLVVTND